MNALDDELNLAVIGGGASGFFAAIQYAEMAPQRKVAIFEKSNQVLQKVRISGGGRCNVTHACFDPKDLAKNYPRGSRELLAAFHRWQPTDMIAWFKNHGVTLKTEADGRMFPVTDSSETVIECFVERARLCKVPLFLKHTLIGIEPSENGGFSLEFEGCAHKVLARSVCLATGSLQSATLRGMLEKLGQNIEQPLPSLFSFNVADARLHELAGVSHPDVIVRMDGAKTPQRGPLLVTHRGFSGPAILRLSAWEAREMAACHHHFAILIDWLPELDLASLRNRFAENRSHQGAKRIYNTPIPPISRRLWERIVECCGIDDAVTWGQISKPATQSLIDALKGSRFDVIGKTTHKDEFVTCGGVSRKCIDFRTMESRVTPGLYFTGECIDIDGITGGFNFQAAWTTAQIAATAIAARVNGG